MLYDRRYMKSWILSEVFRSLSFPVNVVLDRTTSCASSNRYNMAQLLRTFSDCVECRAALMPMCLLKILNQEKKEHEMHPERQGGGQLTAASK
jgi:hypothetical protein